MLWSIILIFFTITKLVLTMENMLLLQWLSSKFAYKFLTNAEFDCPNGAVFNQRICEERYRSITVTSFPSDDNVS